MINITIKTKRKARFFLMRMSMWQPRPYCAEVNDGHLSSWFYTKVKGCEHTYERNRLGIFWQRIWLSILRKVRLK